jgi:hypothetical protein
METRQTHLVNVQGKKIRHWIIKWDETTLQISISSGKLLRWFEDSHRTDRWYTCYDFAYSPDQKYLAARNSLYAANEHQKQLILFDLNNYRTNKLLFSDDSSLYIQGGDSGEIIVRQLL